MDDMKLIMENFREFTLKEEIDTALTIHENLVKGFVEEIRSLHEAKADINEILSKVSNFAKKALNTTRDVKRGAIKTVLTTAINSALKALDFVEDKLTAESPALAGKVRNVLNMLKKDENMTLAVSVVSIIIGLLTGESFDVLGEVLEIIEAAPNILKAYDLLGTLGDAGDFKSITDKTGRIAKNL